ncbi:MAG: type II toxin-antitoxin system RelE/ParE family toxin [Chloroflexi bacterium]|nr:type II toxin-antitoxin system RelE/ParE family toxin [Chloroflexota bacterium]
MLDRLDARMRNRVEAKLGQIQANPYSGVGIGELKGELSGQYRARVGDLRIVYLVDAASSAVVVLAIGHRKEVYRN